MDAQTQDAFDIQERHNAYEGYCSKVFLPFGKKRERIWYGCEAVTDWIWVILLGVFTFNIDSTCGDSVKTDGDVIFWSFLIYTALISALFIMLLNYDNYKENTVFLAIAFLVWMSAVVTSVFVWLFELIATANWTFGYANAPGCEGLYYLIMVNLFWITIPVAFRLMGPALWMFWDWLNTSVFGIPRDQY